MANKKTDLQQFFTVSVVGLSGTEAVRGQVGVGKSCLCNRFVRSAADDYYPEHPSFLSAADFNGQVINNDHFLYWGHINKSADDGLEYSFHIVEQTEFLDDTTFTPLRGGRTDPYLKRCSQIKIQSAEKLMYICRDQLGLEDQFERVTFPSGKVAVDAFICTVDVSANRKHTLETQLDFVNKILLALIKTKKPVVVAATKMDEASDLALQEIHKLINKKEFKGQISVVETSAAKNVNVDTPFLLLAAMIDKSRLLRPKILSYADASKALEERQDVSRQAYSNLLNRYVLDYRVTWNQCYDNLAKNHDYMEYVFLFGKQKAMNQFRNKTAQLRTEYIAKRKSALLNRIPGLLEELFPALSHISNRSWRMCIEHIAQRSDFNRRFVKTRMAKWSDDEVFLESEDNKIPFDLMGTSEVEALFTQHVNALQAEVQRIEYRRQFEDVLYNHRGVLPGVPIGEMEVFFRGRDFYDRLSPLDRSEVYQRVQVDLREKAKKDFLELLYERMDIFYKYDDPDKSITQEDVEVLMELLRTESKCKALGRHEEDRKVIMLNHLGFLQYPIKEQCPFRSNCMELSLQRVLNAKQKRSQINPVNNWTPNPNERQINLLIIGSDGLANDLVNEIRSHFEDDEYMFDDKVFSLDYRTIDGDVSLPQNSLKIPDFTAHGCICVYSSAESLAFIQDTVYKTFLAPSDERLQYQGLPVVLMQALDSSLTDKGYLLLHDDGNALAASLRCEFIEVPDVIDLEDSVDFSQFHETQVPRALREIAIQLTMRDEVDAPSSYRALFGDIRLLMCHMCSDPYQLETILQPFLAMQTCQVVTNDRYHVIQFDTYISDVKQKVEVILASYHEAILLKDEFCHGYILVYSSKRKASYSMMESYLPKIPQIPTLLVAVNDSSMNEGDMLLTNKGKFLAQKYSTLFITTNDFHNQSPYTQLLKEVFESLHKDDSLSYSTLDSSTSSYYFDASPTDPHKLYNSNSGSRKSQRNAFYLGGGWMDNNDIYYKDRIHAPLVDRIEMPDYEEPVDALSDSSEEYALVQDALPAGQTQRIHSTLKRDLKPAFPHTDSESDMSSLERNSLLRSPIARRRVASPKRITSPNTQRKHLSPLSNQTQFNGAPEKKSNSLPRTVVHRVNMDQDTGTQTMKSDTASEGSEGTGDDNKKFGNDVRRQRSLRNSKLRKPGDGGDGEPGFLDRLMHTVTTNNVEKQRKRSLQRKQREEERHLREKQKSVKRKLKSRLKRQSYLFKTSGKTLQDFVQSEGQLIPKFVETCVRFLEREGLLSEGIYRVPGNQNHVELLKEMFEENNTVDIHTLPINQNAVATALKKFFMDLQEPLVPTHLNDELVIADSIPENSSRLLALRGIIKKLPPANHEVLRYLATHLFKIAKNSDTNGMNSQNLAICWWPTIIRPEILSVQDMQKMGTTMQEICVSLIDQHSFFFYNEHEV